MKHHERMKRTIVILTILMFMASGVTIFDASFFSSDHNVSEKRTLPYVTHSSISVNGKASSNGSPESEGVVNIHNLYSYEPAPMGIADYGIGPNNNAFSYNSTSFMGEVNLTDLSTHSSSGKIKCCRDTMTFQLNLNMKFKDGKNTYVYWAQDVMFYNTSSKGIEFLDNIWNISNSNKTLQTNSVSGNGTCSLDNKMSYYYDEVIPSLTNKLAEKIPGKFYMRINVTTYHDQPHLVFMYRYDHPWVTYDNVTFPFVKNLSSNPVFCVDGYNYEPDGYSFYDAELIMGGPGNGSTTMNLGSSLSLSLDFWNGHNYQAVPDAYNFGSDTAEGINNTIASLKTVATDGNLCSNITEGSGSLGLLYSSADVGTLNFVSVINSGYLEIGKNTHLFTGGKAMLTLDPGTYNITLFNTNMEELYHTSVTVLKGKSVTYTQIGKYVQTFRVSGLPMGDTWYVNITGVPSSGPIHGGSYVTVLNNGTYSYTVQSVNRIYHSIQSSFKIHGNNSEINLTFSKVTYSLHIIATGLPSNVTWGVSLNGTGYDAFNSILPIPLSNGTYHFVVIVPAYFTSNITQFNATIMGMNHSVFLDFKENQTSSSFNFNATNIIFIVIVVSVISLIVFVVRRR